MATSLALVKKPKGTSISIITPLKTTLPPSQNKQAIKLLSPRLPPSWYGSWRPRRYGNHFGIPNRCPKCGRSVTEIALEDGREVPHGPWRRTYLALHLGTAH